MAETNSGMAHPQSEASRRVSGAVIMPFAPASLGNSQSESEPSPRTTFTNKNLNEIHEMGEMPEEKPEDGPYGF
jgi:hypothetical protein